ncbi:MAG: hypothetical protein ACRD3Q_16700 [Terriglobales bacterium]
MRDLGWGLSGTDKPLLDAPSTQDPPTGMGVAAGNIIVCPARGPLVKWHVWVSCCA